MTDMLRQIFSLRYFAAVCVCLILMVSGSSAIFQFVFHLQAAGQGRGSKGRERAAGNSQGHRRVRRKAVQQSAAV